MKKFILLVITLLFAASLKSAQIEKKVKAEEAALTQIGEAITAPTIENAIEIINGKLIATGKTSKELAEVLPKLSLDLIRVIAKYAANHKFSISQSLSSDMPIRPDGQFRVSSNLNDQAQRCILLERKIGQKWVSGSRALIGFDPRIIAWSADGKTLVCSNLLGSNIKFFQIDEIFGGLKSGDKKGTDYFSRNTPGAYDTPFVKLMALSPSKKILVAGTANGNILVFAKKEYKGWQEIGSTKISDQQIADKEIGSKKVSHQRILALAWADDGETLFAAVFNLYQDGYGKAGEPIYSYRNGKVITYKFDTKIS